MSSGFLMSRFSTHSFSRLLAALVLALLLLPHFTFAQGPSSERVYQKSESDVHKALQQVHSSIGGRLPVLDGFVDPDQPLDNYSRGYYQCSVQVTPADSGGTLVRVTAKITAWYAGSGSTPGGYRALPSNGRLEADFLDRLDDALGGAASAQTSPAAPPNSAQTSPAQPSSAEPSTALNSTVQSSAAPTPASVAASEPNVANSPSSSKPPLLGAAAPATLPGGIIIPPYNPADSTSSSSAREDLLSPQQKMNEAEQRKDLKADIESLEEIRQNQVHPTNLAVVKRSGTPVLSMPAPSASTIFQADAGDEFEVLDRQENDWIHVRIAGQSRGWMKGAELDLPKTAEIPKSTGDLDRPETPAFHISREETKPFSGKWEPLNGKTVKIIWVEPASGSATSSGKAKRSFAKSVFLKAYRELASGHQSVAGVVIVFDSADGGQISTTLSTLQLWQAGNLSEASFWKRCALDPSDFLGEPSKTTGKELKRAFEGAKL